MGLNQNAECGKVGFTKREAETARNLALRSRDKRRREVRIYHCPVCNMWHLTSRR